MLVVVGLENFPGLRALASLSPRWSHKSTHFGVSLTASQSSPSTPFAKAMGRTLVTIVIAVPLVLFAAREAYNIRLHAVREYGRVIHGQPSPAHIPPSIPPYASHTTHFIASSAGSNGPDMRSPAGRFLGVRGICRAQSLIRGLTSAPRNICWTTVGNASFSGT